MSYNILESIPLFYKLLLIWLKVLIPLHFALIMHFIKGNCILLTVVNFNDFIWNAFIKKRVLLSNRLHETK